MNDLYIPTATYRLQFHHGFRFRDAQAIVPYLQALGIHAVYASPLLKARSGSVHGYDVTDHSTLNPELGGEEDFLAFSDTLRQHEMGLVVDVVPNHMEIDDSENTWWLDVLENGPSSAYASFFDIDWTPPKRDLHNRVLLPVLGDQFGRVLENGELSLFFEDGAFFIAYYEHRFPADPRSLAGVLETVADMVRFTLDPGDPDLIELESIATSLRHLPERTTTDTRQLEERRREKEVAKQRLARLTQASAPVRRAIEGVMVEWSGRKGEPDSFDRLEELLYQQAYRLSNWRVAADEINYRRFFDINDLAAIRVEEPRVFNAVHEVVLRLVRDGRAQGLRVDHPDGLYDPEQYFLSLQNECRRVRQSDEAGTAKLSTTGIDCAIYLVAEKILGRHEQLPANWAVHGTTGYEMLNLINGLFVDPAAQEPLYRFYSQICSGFTDFEDLVYQCKKVILKTSMSSEMHVLARRLDRVSEQHRWSRDFTLWSLHEALREVIACFPVYRTYVESDSHDVSDEDRKHVEFAVRAARRRNPAIDRSIFDFIESVLLLEDPERLEEEQVADRREFVMKMQQLTGPVMAKGLEDTAFYRVYPLVSLNEVGGEPGAFGVALDEFHRTNMVRCGRWPFGMITSSTHDTKRSEDVRAWINVLSEIPEEWISTVQQWQARNHEKKISIEGHDVPDANEEYLLYQTLVGIWPLQPLSDPEHLSFVERLVVYMEKVLREAKVHSSWVSPHPEYEQAVSKFVRSILSRENDNTFLTELQQFRRRLDPAGLCNALAQLVLKICVPGIPDFYQGCELWNFSLVDPDNRRPVDFQERQQLLHALQQEEHQLPQLVEQLVHDWPDGRIKLFTTYRSLNLRRENRDVFLEGDYMPCEVAGDHHLHVCSFVRRSRDRAVLVLVPRLTMQLTQGERLPLGPETWGNTTVRLPEEAPGTWRNVFTGQLLEAQSEDRYRSLPVAQLLALFPVALLEAVPQ